MATAAAVMATAATATESFFVFPYNFWYSAQKVCDCVHVFHLQRVFLFFFFVLVLGAESRTCNYEIRT